MTPSNLIPPYPGLRPFTASERDIFFGRYEQITSLYRQLDRGRFLAIVGASGSGKSSLASAGLIPLLAEETTSGGEPRWTIVAMRPGIHPMNRLAAALSVAGRATNSSLERVATSLRHTTGGLALEAQRLLGADSEVLIVVDQFEELFRYANGTSIHATPVVGTAATLLAHEDEARRFVEALLSASFAPTSSIRVVITMRSDFIGDCSRYPGLAEAVSGNQYLTPRPNRDQLTEAIVAPLLRRAGRLDPTCYELVDVDVESWSALIEPQLVEQIENDAGENFDQLPVLQHALLRCWRSAAGGRLTLDLYRRLGGWSLILSRHADEVMDSCGPERRTTVEGVFRAVTDIDAQGRAMRRPRRLSQLEAETGCAPSDVRAVVDAFSAADCSFLIPPASPDEIVDIGHEALIRSWEILRDRWIPAETGEANQWRALNNAIINLDFAGKSLITWWHERQPTLPRLARWGSTDPAGDHERAVALIAKSENKLWENAQTEERVRKAEVEQERAARSVAESEERAALAAKEAAEKSRQLWRRLFALAAATMVLLLGGLVYVIQLQRSEAAQKREVQVKESLLLAQLANRETLAGDAVTGALLALRALPASGDRPYVPEAHAALFAAIYAQRERTLLRGHGAAVLGVAVSPDGTRLASASRDNTVRLWEAATGKELQVLRGHDAAVWGTAFSPDGTRLASASEDKTVRLWDATTGKELLALRGHDAAALGVAFSPDETRLASASRDNTVRLWDAATGKELLALRGHDAAVWGVAFSPDGQRLASASTDRTVRLWDAATGKELLALRGHDDAIRRVTFSPDGQRLASTSEDKTVRLWEAATGKELLALRGHDAAVWGVAFSPDGQRLASTSWDKTVRLWEAATGKEVLALRGHDDAIRGVTFSPDGQRLASASEDKTVRLWDAATGKEQQALRGHDAAVWGVAFSPDGQRLASASWDNTVRLWDAATGKELLALRGHDAAVWGVAFSPDGQRLASASEDKTVRLWDAATGKELQALRGHDAAVWGVAFSPDGQRLASASEDKTVRLWDAATGKELLAVRGHDDAIRRVTFSPDGQRLASASEDKTVRLRDAATGKELLALRAHDGAVLGVAFSPDGTRLASASWDNTVRLWDAATGKEVQALRGHDDAVWGVAFSPDGQRLAGASRDNTVRLWDAATGKELLALRAHDAAVWGVAFSPDGQRLASASEDKTVRLWWAPQNLDDLITEARKRLPRQLTPEQEEEHFYLEPTSGAPAGG